jgi:hypothetical protein
MRHLLAALAVFALAVPSAKAQEASKAETKAVSTIVECLAAGLPEDWQRAKMIVELAKPGADTGDVEYVVARASAPDKFEPFTPCDVRKPARTLLEARKTLAPKRRAWTAATLLLQRDGKFALNYDYPKAEEPRRKK